MEFLIAIVAFILIFGLVVFIHEFGHFWVAKKVGVIVEEFAFGFGPKLLSKEWKGTLYRVNAIPLGGYVKMLGDQDGSSFARITAGLFSQQERETAISLLEPKNLHKKDSNYKDVVDFVKNDSSLSKKEREILHNYIANDFIPNHPGNLDNARIIDRLAIVVAGVIMNFLLGIVLFYILFFLSGFILHLDKIGDPVIWGADTGAPPVLYQIYNQDGVDDQVGGIILKVNDESVVSEEQFINILEANHDKQVELEFLGQTETKEVILTGEELYSNFSEELRDRIVITEIEEDSAAAKSELEVGDIFLEIAGVDISELNDLRGVLENNKGKSTEFVVIDKTGNPKDINVDLPSPEDGQLVLGVGLAITDIFLEDVIRISYEDSKALSGVSHASNILVYNITAFGEFIGQSFDQKSIKPVANNVGSVVAVFDVTFSLVQVKDFYNILNLAAMLSVTLAFMNLLPIPLLDGGHVLFLIYEAVVGRPISEKTQESIAKVVFYLLILITILVVVKDIAQLDWPTRILATIKSSIS